MLIRRIFRAKKEGFVRFVLGRFAAPRWTDSSVEHYSISVGSVPVLQEVYGTARKIPNSDRFCGTSLDDLFCPVGKRPVHDRQPEWGCYR